MKERTQLVIKLISTHIILVPLLIIISLFINRDSLLLLSITQTILMILYFTGYWEFFGLRFRIIYFLLIEFFLFIVFSLKFLSHAVTLNNWYLIAILILLQIFLLSELIKIIIVIFKQDKGTFDIEFPFKHGKYLITDGGNSKISRLMNYHFYSPIHKKNKTNYSMLFATDIVKIDNPGPKFLPAQNEDYLIFGERVYSPVSGLVIKVENNIEDNIPYSGNYPYNTGNSIIIRKDNKYLILGHLKKGSIKLEEGDSVLKNDMIAEAGNSGYSERPHIHMQLIECLTDNYWQGLGISIRFKNKNLYKNRVVDV
jgi:hypothetical protein